MYKAQSQFTMSLYEVSSEFPSYLQEFYYILNCLLKYSNYLARNLLEFKKKKLITYTVFS